MGIAERKARQRQLVRNQILDATLDIIRQEGLEHVSMRRIAERIEYSPTTIYLHFKHKDEVLAALHFDGFKRLYERKKPLMDNPNSLERLGQLGMAYMQFGLDYPAYYELMFHDMAPIRAREEAQKEQITQGEASLPPYGHDIHQDGVHYPEAVYNMLAQTAQECLDKGLIEPESQHVVAFSMWAYVHGMTALMIKQRLSMYPEQVVTTLMQSAHDYMQRLIRKKPG